jgi:D-proline reductase (dithiol) PrdB
MPDNTKQETFKEFKNSFAYGSRNDLGFKFLASLSDQDAGKFLQDLLWKLGDAFDDGQFDRIVEHVYEWQLQAYAGESNKWAYDKGPFTPLQKPLSESRLALMSSSGHFVEGDDPEPFGVKNMTQEEAVNRILQFIKSELSLSRIPVGTPREKLRVRHGGYDVRGAQADPNVVFPHEILLELEKKGHIGELAREAYSFMGACSQKRLLKESGPQWVRLLQEKQIDAALLIPV